MIGEPLRMMYETKCRRCGTIHQWAFMHEGDSKLTEKGWLALHYWCGEHLNIPSVSNCDVCKKSTIQDYIAYTGKGGDGSYEHNDL